MSTELPDTTAPSYWLNWRFLLCAIWILGAGAIMAIMIWKYEWLRKRETARSENQQDAVGSSNKDEAWRPCLKVIHPAWLLAYRLAAFCVLLAIILTDLIQHGGLIFIFYTQWTFTLVIIYFGLASAFSIYGCCLRGKKDSSGGADQAAIDAEAGTYVNPTSESTKPNERTCISKTADTWGFVFQIIYQICAGAVILTDLVFWCVLYPFFWDRTLVYLDVCFHGLNAVLLIGDTFLNSLPFHFFRIAYFILWTGLFVVVQWIIHACISIAWPYEFLDLSSSYAPLWYFGVGFLHLPCYGVFALIVKLKHLCLSRCFPDSFQHSTS